MKNTLINKHSYDSLEKINKINSYAIKSEKTFELTGKVTPSGSKNVGLKLLALTPLFRQPFSLINVPRNNQVRYIIGLLNDFGIEVNIMSDDEKGFLLNIRPGNINRQEFSNQEVGWCRHIFLMATSILLQTGSVLVPLPGYSHYGYRPIDGQLSGLRQLGAIVSPVENGKIRIEIPEKGLKGNIINLTFPSNAVTECLILAALVAKGTTVINGAANEPETLQICDFLLKAGAKIEGIGTPSITVVGQELDCLKHPENFDIMPDRIEIATLGAALSICGGEIWLERTENYHISSILGVLNRMGILFHYNDDYLILKKSKRLLATDITTGPFPCFPTDGLGPYLTALSLSDGVSVISERMWSNRLSLTMELKRLGANIDMPNGQLAIIKGVERLSGAPVVGTDPRATAALILAGLAAEGETIVYGIDLLDNAYDSIDTKLISLGANIERIRINESDYSRRHPVYGRLEAF